MSFLSSLSIPPEAAAFPEPERFAGRITLKDGATISYNRADAGAQFAADARISLFGYASRIHVATNPDITFRVQKFNLARAQQRNSNLGPDRDFASRLIWGRGSPNEGGRACSKRC